MPAVVIVNILIFLLFKINCLLIKTNSINKTLCLFVVYYSPLEFVRQLTEVRGVHYKPSRYCRGEYIKCLCRLQDVPNVVQYLKLCGILIST